ncbi:MAG: DUF4350 domain-containing protein [Gammaproteobacteria bacterium]|nr:DUF4350 domain-containing protein [Gammaproteobacteria bacterium]
MSRGKLILFTTLMVVIVAAAALWARNNMYYETVESRIPPSVEAQRNRFLAAERLLATQDIAIERKISRSLFNNLNNFEDQALWVFDPSNIKIREEMDQLLNWVENGGHLILQIRRLPRTDSELLYTQLKSRGIELVLSRDEQYPDNRTSEVSIPIAEAKGRSILVELHHRQVFKTELNARLQVGDNAIGSRLLQVGVGDGFITLLSDNTAFSNYGIESGDNAYLLLWLLNANPKLSTLAIMEDLSDTPGLFRTLFSTFTLTVLTLLAVVAAYLVKASTRHGPVLQEPAPGGKNLISHLRARGFFLARQRKLDPMLLPVRTAATHALSRKRGVRRVKTSTQTLDTKAYELAAKLADCTPEQAEKALNGELSSSRELVDSGVILHRIIHAQTHASSAVSKERTTNQGTATS